MMINGDGKGHTGVNRFGRDGLREIQPDLIMFDFGVKYGDLGVFGQEVLNKGDGCGFTSVPSISFECKAQDGDTLQ
jgi:hypothetical protein